MKRLLNYILIYIAFGVPASFGAKVGDPAPLFEGIDAQGKTISLTEFKGKFVVLEWHNPKCPYVVAQYEARQMQNTQKTWTDKGVIWLSINSSAVGKEGHVDGKSALAYVKRHGATPSAIILDADGKIGKSYEAKTTPHMFVINPDGILIYNGAIDNTPTYKTQEVGKGNINYVSSLLEEAFAGKTEYTYKTTKAYGCGVKY